MSGQLYIQCYAEIPKKQITRRAVTDGEEISGHVDLKEQQDLQELIARRSGKAAAVKRAYILLAEDENGSQQWTDANISTTYHVRVRTVERVRQRFVEVGLHSAVYGQPDEIQSRPRHCG
ncbi:MAG: hypothetical protein WHX52_22165 [Anaerolineae bacterium]